MALQLIIGGSGTGKSTRLYQMVIEQAAAHPERRFLLLVPEQYNMQTNRNMIRLHPDHAFMNIDILSFERLAYRVFDELGVPVDEILQDTGKSMLVRRLLAENKDRLHTYAGNIRRQGFAVQMRSMISEFIQYGVTPEDLKAKSALLGDNAGLYGKMKDMQVIYSAFMDFIKSRYMTAEELLSRLARVIDRSSFVRESFIFMDGYTGFTPVQYTLLSHILALSPGVVMTIASDVTPDLYHRPDREDLFGITRETIYQLDKLCSEQGIERDDDILLTETYRFGERRDLLALEQNCFRTRITPWQGKCGNVELHCLHDPDAEMRFAAMRIHELVCHEGMRYSDIAIVTSDMDRFARKAANWFKKYGIPCFFDRRRPVKDNMLAEWLRALLGIFLRNFSYDAVFGFLRNGLSGFEQEDVDILENYVLAAGIRGAKRWQTPWTVKTGGVSDGELERLNALRARLADSLSEVTAVLGKRTAAVSEMITAITGLMEHEGLSERMETWQHLFEERGDLERAAEYDQFYDVLMDLLNETGRILGDETITPRGLLDVLETGLTEVRIGMIPPGIDQVLFGDLRRTRPPHIKVLIFAGMNDGLIPLPQQSTGLITEQEREFLAEHKIRLAPSAQENFSTERYYLYAALSRPSQRLIMTYSTWDSAGAACQPAAMLRQVRKILPELKTGTGIHVFKRSRFADIHQAWRYLMDGLRHLADGEEVSGDWYGVYRWFSHNAAKEKTLDTLTDAAFYAYTAQMLSPETVDKLYHGRLDGGVTMLERYAACAYSHFLLYGLRLKQRQIYRVLAPDLGTILHDALSRFAAQAAESGYGWRDMPDQLRDDLAERSIRDAAGTYNHAVLRDTARSLYMIERLSGLMKRTVKVLQAQLRKGSMEPFASEIAFTTEVVSDALVAENRGGSLVMHGRIDRMDRHMADDQVTLRVIDYKSGNVSLDPTLIYYGIQLQLMVYMNAACDQTKARQTAEAVVPAGIFYYHIGDPFAEAGGIQDLTDDGSVPDEELMKSLRMDGLAVGTAEDDSLIRLMDGHPEEKPPVLPVTYNKDGISESRSSIISPEDFAWLSVFVKRRETMLADRIFNGDIAVDPYVCGKLSACTYCDFKAVCGFEAGSRGYAFRRLRRINKDEGFEKLAKEAEQHGR